MSCLAFQGVKGAFSHITALKEHGNAMTYIGCDSFKEVFEKLSLSDVDRAIIPIENSLIGSIYENYDLLQEYDMHILSEHFTRIEHCLLAKKPLAFKEIRKVLSHPKAIAQCQLFFHNHPWIEAVNHMDTAGAAKEIAQEEDPTVAAIASKEAAKLYGLEILQKRLEDNPKNYTRFFIIAKKPKKQEANKCSLLFTLKHEPGSLIKVLSPFAEGGINITKIESRPLKGSLFEYVFYLDFEFLEKKQEEIKTLVRNLSPIVSTLHVLGFYKKGAL